MNAKKITRINLIIFIIIAIMISIANASTESPDEEEDYDDEVDDDSKIYKNPRNFPSAECPRDEEQATLLGQKCLRKCSSDEDCKSRKKKCLCDGACGKSCIKPDRECPELQQPALGSVTLSGKTFGSRATYTCPHGYHVVGLQSRLCQADGNWAGTEPACKQNIYCLAPPTIEHARHSALPEQATFDLDSTVQYHCHLGYSTAGFPRAKCLAIDGQASWYGPDISCEPRSCGQPTDPVNGWHAGECYTYGCRITYQCGEGYELVGKQEKFCQADGSWTPKELPTCVLVTAVQCPPPENPKNGKAIYTSCSYNSVVSYECKYGYTLVGESSRRCGADKKWSGQTPLCKEINCGHPGILFNGWLENIDAGTGLGASVIFRCHPGMLLVGNSSTVCQIDGKWRYSLPHCLAPCVVPSVSQGIVIPIHEESEINNGSTTTGYSLSSKVRHGTSLEVLCNENYEFPLSSQLPPTCYNGTWSIIPKCVPAKCKTMPKAPKFGIVLAAKTEHGMRAVFKCKDGFILKSPNGTQINDTSTYALTCSFGNWTGETPYCQEVYCQFPGYIEHGKVLLVGNMGLYDYRPYVKKVINNKQIMYDCDKGYVLEEGPPGATCIGGRWSPSELPKCLLGQHPRIRWNRRRRSSDSIMSKLRTQYIVQQFRVSIAKLNTVDRLKRETEQIFNNTDESDPTFILNADEKKQRNKLPCEPPPKGVKIEIIKASKDSKLSFGQGVVIKVLCDTANTSNTEQFNNTFKCIKGQWKPDIPKCSATPCLVPTSEHGKYFKNKPGHNVINDTALSAKNEIGNDEVLMFICDNGYNLQGPNSIKCNHGKWITTSFPECLPSPCVLPYIQQAVYQGGYRAGLTIAHSSSVIIQCETSSGVRSSIQLECTLGKLIPENIKCENLLLEPAMNVVSDVSSNNSIASTIINTVNNSCKSPQKFDEYLNYKHDMTTDAGFPDGTEILFSCIPSVTGETKTWKIICEGGTWVGRAVPCETDEDGFSNIPLINGSCIYRNNEPQVISFYNDLEIREEYVEFPPDSTIISRCIDIGKYAMIGSNERKCVKSKWTGTKPHCFGLNQENDYAMEKAPTILFRHQNGPIAQSNNGKLIVYPGATVHMECLWMRRFGNPKWNVSHEYRKYPEGWTTEEGRDPQLEYRLSILHAVKEDSGIYTCSTPARHTHSIEVEVKAVHCAPLISRRGLALSSTDTMMNARITFRCTNGNALIGAHDTTCLPSGNWSSPLPVCESVECGDVPLLLPINTTAPRVTVLSREVGGRAAFSCPIGYGIRGPSESICLGSGEWSTPFPSCVEVQCQHPGAPQNGYAQGSPPYRAGDVVQFNCNPEFMMQGQPIIACQDNGRWSGGLPKCIQACSYPGTAISGRMSNVKFYYNVGEIITFSCDAGLELRGTKMIRCLKNGKWSNAIPTCVTQTLSVISDVKQL